MGESSISPDLALHSRSREMRSSNRTSPADAAAPSLCRKPTSLRSGMPLSSTTKQRAPEAERCSPRQVLMHAINADLHLFTGSEKRRRERHPNLEQRFRQKPCQRVRRIRRRNLSPGTRHTLHTDRFVVHDELGTARRRRNARRRSGIDDHPPGDVRRKRGHEWRRRGALRTGKPLITYPSSSSMSCRWHRSLWSAPELPS